MNQIRKDTLDRCERVVDYMHDNLDGDLSLDKLAEVACYSRFHFQRLYTSVRGESLAQTAKRLRHAKAAGTLLKTDASVENIAKQYGFASAQSFSHGFRSEMGQSPSQFRKNKTEKWSNLMHEVKIESHPKRRLAAIPHKGSYMEIGKAFEQLGMRLHGSDAVDWSKPAMIGIYYDDPQNTPESELKSDAAMMIKDGAELPEGTVERVLSEGKCAEALFKGPYAEISPAWEWFYGKWLAESGETPRDEPPFEVYLNDPSTTKPQDLLTKICIPIEG